MESNIKPIILVVHGGWHVPESYKKLTTALQSAGYEVHVPHLPSTKNPLDSDLSIDTECIRSYTEDLIQAGHTIVALMHSYGGQVGTNALHGLGLAAQAAQGLDGGVSHLIYMSGFAISEGVSMMDKVAEFDQMDLVPLVFEFDPDDTCVSGDPKALVVGPGCAEEETQAYLSTFVRWNGRTMFEPLQNCAWREIPVTYIHTTEDITLPIQYQRAFVEDILKAGQKVRTFELGTGHCPNFTATQEVVEIINEVVLGEGGRKS
ncbi:alpha/beta-hydrolase [Hypoxylon sp. NC1633]|nr:alpha/beta-hydrolase [Hypoxylon sp. NC1633]